MSKKMNLKKLTMSFATAAVVPAPVTDQPETMPDAAALVSQKISQMKEAKAPKAAKTDKTTKTAKAPVRVKPEVVKTPVAKKAPAPAAKKDRDPNTLLSNNFRTFQVVGTTQFKGSQKIWFANETATKVKNMEKQGHTDIYFINLPQPMTKEQVLVYLAENPTFLPQELVTEKQERLTVARRARS